jgi:hypothetical protein
MRDADHWPEAAESSNACGTAGASCHRSATAQSAFVFALLDSLPLLIPGIVVALTIGILASGRVGAWLGIHRGLAAFLIFSLGVIIAGTLTPLEAGEVLPPELRATCDLSRLHLATAADLANGNDVAINILMFMPFGFAVGSIRWSWRKLGVMIGAIALPLVIEGVQLTVLSLGRGCQSADVIDNLTGLVIGFCAGVPLSWWAGNAPGRHRGT